MSEENNGSVGDQDQLSCCSSCEDDGDDRTTDHIDIDGKSCTSDTGSSSYSGSLGYSDQEANVEWIEQNCNNVGHLFYLRSLDQAKDGNDDGEDGKDGNMAKGKPDDTVQAMATVKKSKDRFQESTYSKITSWFRNRRNQKSGSIKKAKRKSTIHKSRRSKKRTHLEQDSNGTINANDNGSRTGSHVIKNDNPKINIISSEEEPDLLFNIVKGMATDDQSNAKHQSYYESWSSNNSSKLTSPRLLIMIYLTAPSQSSSSDKNESLLFAYPNQNIHDMDGGDEKLAVIAKLKGMFITLSQVVNEISSQLPIVSKIEIHSKEQKSYSMKLNQADQFSHEDDCSRAIDKIYNIAYAPEFSSLLISAVPENRIRISELINITQSMARLMKFLFNSLDAAFQNETYHQEIRQILDVLSFLLFGSHDYKHYDIKLYFNTVQQILIDDDELVLSLNEVLSEYESMDWLSEMDEQIEFGTPNDYMVVGSCIYYRNYLIASHLPDNYLIDINCFVQFRGILPLIKSHPVKLIIWREVNPTSNRKTDSLTSDFPENDISRYFMLIVAIEQTLFCAILEMPFITMDSIVKPNELIINETIRYVASTLNRSGLIDQVDHNIKHQADMFDSSSLFTLISEKNKQQKSISLKDLLSYSNNRVSQDNQNRLSGSFNSDSFYRSSFNKSRSTPSLQKSNYSSQGTGQCSNGSSSSSVYKSSSNTFTKTESNYLMNSESCVYLCKHQSLSTDLPEKLVLFQDINHNNKSFIGPIFPENKIYNRISKEIFEKFKAISLLLSENVQKYPYLSECGNQFTIKSENSSKFRAKKYENSDEILFWTMVKRDINDRELFACYYVKKQNLEFFFDDFAYKLNLRNKV